MKLFFLSTAIAFFSLNSLAGEPRSQYIEGPYTVEPSFSVSSIGGGSQFQSLAVTARLSNWMRVGVEGDLSADIAAITKMSMVRLLARAPLLDGTNKVYFQASIASGAFSESSSQTKERIAAKTFNNVEITLGFSHNLSENWSVGGRFGVLHSDLTVASQPSHSYFHSRMTFFGSYAF